MRKIKNEIIFIFYIQYPINDSRKKKTSNNLTSKDSDRVSNNLQAISLKHPNDKGAF